MALRPGRQRSSATPIIAKRLVYPLQNRRASKLATHGFASKSDTHHNKKHHPVFGAVLFALLAGDACPYIGKFEPGKTVEMFTKLCYNESTVKKGGTQR